jgi:hypothetical protein
MKLLKDYLGFIPLTIIIIPSLIAAIRQAIFYQGCMDGYGYMVIAMIGFIYGGILNVAYLLFALIDFRNLKFDLQTTIPKIKRINLGVAFGVFIVQCMIVALIIWDRYRSN